MRIVKFLSVTASWRGWVAMLVLIISLGGARIAVAEIEQVDVYVYDALPNAKDTPIVGAAVQARRAGTNEYVSAEVITDSEGRASFSIDFDGDRVRFVTWHHDNPIRSEYFIRNPGTVQLMSGNLEIQVELCGSDGRPRVPNARVDFINPINGKRYRDEYADAEGIALTHWNFTNKPEAVVTTRDMRKADRSAEPLKVNGPGTYILCADYLDMNQESDLPEMVPLGDQVPGQEVGEGVEEISATDAAIAAAQAPYQLLGRLTYGLTPNDIKQGIPDYDTVLNAQLETNGDLQCLGLSISADGAIQFDELLDLKDSVLKSSATATVERFAAHTLTMYQMVAAAINPCGLREVLTQFWENHFATDLRKTSAFATELKVNELGQQGTLTEEQLKIAKRNGGRAAARWEYMEHMQFKANALGNFRDLLSISAKSPAMNVYLDTISSTNEANENYARELLELHTTGVGAGYTQQDIVTLSQAFSGLEIDTTKKEWPVACDETRHYFGALSLDLGLDNPIQLEARDSETFTCGDTVNLILDALVDHPKTAEHVCWKLVQKLVREDPPADVVDGCIENFIAHKHSDDQIAQIVREIASHPFFYAPTEHLGKIKTNLELTVSALRALELVVPGNNLTQVERYLSEPYLHMDLFEVNSPEGFPEEDTPWMSSNQLMQRMRLVNHLIYGSWHKKDLEGTQYFDPVAYFQRHHVESSDEIIDFMMLLTRSSFGDFSDELMSQAEAILSADGAFDMNDVNADTKLRRVVALFLGSPNFQLQ